MFGNLDIKLGAEKKTYKKDKDIDVLDLYDGVVAATENLERGSLQLDNLYKTAENMERGQQLAAAVADATGDNATAVAVGRESLRMSLSMIGQGHLADEAYAGAESVTAGAEGASDFFKGVWDKIKEYALKVWKWLKDLISKVVRFVLGIFGKAEDTAEKLTEMLKKLKAEGRTRLEETEFPKDVRLRLAKEMPLIVAANKTLTSTEILDYIDKGIVVTDKKLTDVSKFFGTDDDTASKTLKENINGLKEANGYNALVTTDSDNKVTAIPAATYTAIKNVLGDIVDGTGKPTVNKNDVPKSVDAQDAVDEQASDIEVGTVMKVSQTPEHIKLVVYGLTENGKEAYTAFTKDSPEDVDGEIIGTDTGKFTRTLNQIIAGIKVVNVTVKIDDISDATDNEEGITPLDHSEATDIAKKLKDVSKDLEKGIKELNKRITKSEKEAEKVYKSMSNAVDTLDKTDPVEKKKVGKAVASAYQKVLKTNLEISRAYSAGAAETSKEIVRSKFSHIINESVKLYIKK